MVSEQACGRRAGDVLFAVVDSFDAMTSQRPYRDPVTTDEALGEIQRKAGSQFDPGIVTPFLPVAQEWHELADDTSLLDDAA